MDSSVLVDTDDDEDMDVLKGGDSDEEVINGSNIESVKMRKNLEDRNSAARNIDGKIEVLIDADALSKKPSENPKHYDIERKTIIDSFLSFCSIPLYLKTCTTSPAMVWIW